MNIKNSYIWDKVIIEDNCNIEFTIITDNVHIKKGVNIQSGSMISFGVVVKEGVTIPKASMVSKYTFSSHTLKFEEC